MTLLEELSDMDERKRETQKFSLYWQPRLTLIFCNGGTQV